jgi:hypothetical protein
MTIKSASASATAETPLAFPTTYGQCEGMTLRDYFAAKAMITLMSSPAWVQGLDLTLEDFVQKGSVLGMFKEYVAGHAYQMADEMLKARKGDDNDNKA